jgi:hypothetical protein
VVQMRDLFGGGASPKSSKSRNTLEPKVSQIVYCFPQVKKIKIPISSTGMIERFS